MVEMRWEGGRCGGDEMGRWQMRSRLDGKVAKAVLVVEMKCEGGGCGGNEMGRWQMWLK